MLTILIADEIPIEPLQTLHVKEPVNFIVIADWGGKNEAPYTTKAQLKVAWQILEYSENNNLSFILSLGDHFYPNGVTSSYDQRFKWTYEDIYLHGKVKYTPWFLTLGNHDHRYGNGYHQIEYGNRTNMWNLPDYFYEFVVIIEPNLEPKRPLKRAKFIMIDTTLLCNLFDHINRAERDYLNENHYKWLENKLKKSISNDYLFVVGHHPIISQMSSRDGSSCMKNIINPLLLKYRVTAYFGAHDHTLQHNQYTHNEVNHTVDYFVSGAGSNVYRKERKNASDMGHSVFYWNNYTTKAGFLRISLYKSYYEYEFQDANGRSLHNGSVKPIRLYSSNIAMTISVNYLLYMLSFVILMTLNKIGL